MNNKEDITIQDKNLAFVIFETKGNLETILLNLFSIFAIKLVHFIVGFFSYVTNTLALQQKLESEKTTKLCRIDSCIIIIFFREERCYVSGRLDGPAKYFYTSGAVETRIYENGALQGKLVIVISPTNWRKGKVQGRINHKTVKLPSA